MMEPKCDRKDCFACMNGWCVALSNNDFGERDCPFFKTQKQLDAERREIQNRRKTIETIETPG